MARSGGISGVAVGAAAAGAFLVYSGIKGVPVAQGLRDLAAGRTPVGSPSPAAGADPTSGGSPVAGSVGAVPSSTGGSAIATAATRYLGIPYRWGKATPTDGFDCSGLVTWVLHHDLGYSLPSNTHTTALMFYAGAGGTYTVPRKAMQAGDLVCWPSHIGIAVDGSRMVHAPHTGDVVKISPVWTGCIIRRLGSNSNVTRAR